MPIGENFQDCSDKFKKRAKWWTSATLFCMALISGYTIYLFWDDSDMLRLLSISTLIIPTVFCIKQLSVNRKFQYNSYHISKELETLEEYIEDLEDGEKAEIKSKLALKYFANSFENI